MSSKAYPRKPILCLDFDGVCSTYESGWQGEDIFDDPPVPGLFDFLHEADKVFEIHVYSTRSARESGRYGMRMWFWRHYEKYAHQRGFAPGNGVVGRLRFPQDKPPAFVTLGRSVVTFTGTWPSVVELRAFKPWHKQ